MWSLAMIVRNEEANLAAALEGARQFCDELVVVDTGSTDDTVKIAKQFGAKVSYYPWDDNFSAARNKSFARAIGDWIFWMDADDTLSDDAIAAFQELKRFSDGKTDVDVIWSNLVVYDANGLVTYSHAKPRVVRRAASLQWVGMVHEYIDVTAARSSFWPSAWVEDHASFGRIPTDRNLRILEKAIAGPERTGRNLYYYANELRDHKRFSQALNAYRDYLEVGFGWEVYDSLNSMGKCQLAIGTTDAAKASFLRAVGEDPTRADAFMALGEIEYIAKNYERAIPYFKATCGMKRPETGFAFEAHYTWLPWDRLAICFSEIGEYEGAIAATEQALKTCPDRARLEQNVAFYRSKLTAPPIVPIELPEPPKDVPHVVVHILARDKAATLPYYLETLEAWDYPKHAMTLCIRTNNNSDATAQILKDWMAVHASDYHSVAFDDSDVNAPITGLGIHEWNPLRFQILGELRGQGIDLARAAGADFYFTSDVDNFLAPHTLSTLVAANLGVIAPLVINADGPPDDPTFPYYANFHETVNERGYYQRSLGYSLLFTRQVLGIHEVALVHCAYLLRRDVFDAVSYLDDTEDHEYVIMARHLRAKGVYQYLDNREVYGVLTLNEDADACRQALSELNAARTLTS